MEPVERLFAQGNGIAASQANTIRDALAAGTVNSRDRRLDGTASLREGIALAPACVAACRNRFHADPFVTVIRTDGASLPGVADDSVDFAFSFDALVHVEAEVMSAYLTALRSNLHANGAVFPHHSNLGASRARVPDAPNHAWCGESVSAEAVRVACEQVELICATQEIIEWGGIEDYDCLSVILGPGAQWTHGTVVSRNREFFAEARSIAVRESLHSHLAARKDAGSGEARTVDDRNGGDAR
jgi:hypothetical protein